MKLLEVLKSKTSKTNMYGPKGWKTIQKKIDKLKSLKNDEDNDGLTIKYN